MSTEPTIGGTVQSGEFTVTSSHETPEQMSASLADPETTTDDGGDEPDLSKAASDLGKKGGEAAAAKRAAEAKEAEKAERAAEKAAKANEADASTPDERTEEEKKLGKPRHDPRARMLEATRKEAEAKREAAEARREREEARAEAARYRAELEQAKAGKPDERPQPKQASDDAPKEEDFESYTEFLRASVRHEIQQEQRQQAERHREMSRQEKVLGTLQGWKEAMLKAADSDPEFVDKTAWLPNECRPSFTMPDNDPRQLDPRTWIANEMVHNPESAPALALHFSEHRDDYQRIASLQTQAQVIREMAKIATRLDAPTATTTSPSPSVSKAKPPVRSVAGAPPTVGEPDPDSASFDEHYAFYEGKARRR